jgi:C-terminal processing protease CtpA/Prc
MAAEVGLVGIGAVLITERGCMKVESVKPNGGAAASGNVHVGDVLVAINGIRLTSQAHARELILGPSATSLKVELSRSGQPVTVTLWRGGLDAKMKGEAAEKAKYDAEAKLKHELNLKNEAFPSIGSLATCSDGLSSAAFKGQSLALP